MVKRNALYDIWLDHINKTFAMTRGMQAEGSGLEPAGLAEPYHAPSTNIFAPQIVQPPSNQEQQEPAETAKKAGSLLKTLAMTALMATGGGGLVAAGGFGAYSLLKEQLNKPVQIDPATFKTKISFDPDKGGMQVGPLEPAK